MIFADTSALYAVLVESDRGHRSVVPVWDERLLRGEPFVTTSYVVHETVTLLQARVGIEAVVTWRAEVEPVLQIVWIDRVLHEQGLTALTSSAKRDVSLTDWVSFEVMRRRAIRKAFTLDRHFAAQGFDLVPPRTS